MLKAHTRGDSDVILFYISKRHHVGGILPQQCNVLNLDMQTVQTFKIHGRRITLATEFSDFRTLTQSLLMINVPPTRRRVVRMASFTLPHFM